jgi:hypothetical protein
MEDFTLIDQTDLKGKLGPSYFRKVEIVQVIGVAV